MKKFKEWGRVERGSVLTEQHKQQPEHAEDRPQNAPGASPRDSDPLEGWIPWEKRFSTAGAARVLVANGKPVEQVQVPEGGKMKPGVPMQRQERRQDAWKKIANEGKWKKSSL